MFISLIFLALFGAAICLWCLARIDLRIGLLPNEYVLGLALCGTLFHLATFFQYAGLADMALGAFLGGGILYFIKTAAACCGKKDALGWGDIKLMAAGGILLGPYHIMLALVFGALAGILHGLTLHARQDRTASLMDLSLPAGPGFIIGIVMAAALAFHNLGNIL